MKTKHRKQRRQQSTTRSRQPDIWKQPHFFISLSKSMDVGFTYQNAVHRVHALVNEQCIEKMEMNPIEKEGMCRPEVIIGQYVPADVHQRATAFVATTKQFDKSRRDNIKAIREMNRILPGSILHDAKILAEMEKQMSLAAYGTREQMAAAQDWLEKIASPLSEGAKQRPVSRHAIRFFFPIIYEDIIFLRTLFKELNGADEFTRDWAIDKINKGITKFIDLPQEWKDLILPSGRGVSPIVCAAMIFGSRFNRHWRNILKQVASCPSWNREIKLRKNFYESTARATAYELLQRSN